MRKFKFKDFFGFRFGRAHLSQRADSATEGKTDISRWSENTSFPASWSSRAAVAAGMIAGYKSVCDIGCGMQDLRRELGVDVTYLPMDVVQRTPDTIVCEINKFQLPETYIIASDIVTLLGVVEYIPDPRWLLSQLSAKSPALLVTYCISDEEEDASKRRERGWMNDFSSNEFEHILLASGYSIVDRKPYSANQNLWLCKSPLKHST